jgi:hypothetical protein
VRLSALPHRESVARETWERSLRVVKLATFVSMPMCVESPSTVAQVLKKSQ